MYQIWNFIKGPFEDPEVEGLFVIECLIETEEGLNERFVYLPTLEGCYEVEKYFKWNIEPLSLDDIIRIIDESDY